MAVLGMHRSGTSWLTGALQDLGLELGDVSTSNKYNRKGNRENRQLRQLHEDVLRTSGGSWRHPKWPNRWSRQQRAQLAAHVAEMSTRYTTWGFKDPRALLVLDEWHRQVENLERVGIYRHPLAVYRSLHARHADFTEEEAVHLWTFYNTRLLAEHEEAPFPVIRFDVAPEVRHAQLTTVGLLLELDRPEGPDRFFDEQLVHNRDVEVEAMPSGATRVWEELERIRLERAD